MAGILDFLQSPDAQLGIGLLAAGGPTTDPNRTSFGQRLQGAMQGMDAQAQQALKNKLLQSQINENTSQDAMRKQQLAMAQRQMAMQNQLLGFDPNPTMATPASTASASGVMPTTPPVAGAAPTIPNGSGSSVAGMPSALPQQSAGTLDAMSKQYGIPAEALKYDLVFNGGKGIAEMVAKRGTPDMQVANGYAYDKNKLQSGTFLPQLNMSQDGKASMVQIGPDGQPVVSAPRGAVDTYSAYQGAQANYKPIKVYNPATQREEFTSEGAVVGGGVPRALMQRTGNPMIDAVIQTESGGNPNAVSSKGAQGIMQVMPTTNAAPGFGVAPAKDGSEAERVRVGQEYLAALSQKYQNPTLAAIAYNWGPGNTDAWLKAGGDYAKLPPETKNYVSAVMTRTAVNGLGQGQPATQVAAAPAGNMAAGPSVGETNAAAADKEYQTNVAKDQVEQRKSIMNAGFVAPSKIAKLQQIDKLLGDFEGGKLSQTGVDFASAMNSLGIKVDKNLPNKEAAQAMSREIALSLRNPAGGAGMPGALSDADRNFLSSMTPDIGQTAQGRKQIITSGIAIEKRNQQVSDFARKYEAKYGKLDNGFYSQLSAWSSANPLFAQ